jgi:hypothetical protein
MPTCRPGSSVLDGLQPGRQAQHGESGDTSTSPLAVSNRFAALDTSDSGLGPQAIAPGPRAVLFLPLSHRRPTPTAQYLYPSDRTPRYSKRWDVERARSEGAEARSQTCGRELTLTSKDITVCAIQDNWTPQ